MTVQFAWQATLHSRQTKKYSSMTVHLLKSAYKLSTKFHNRHFSHQRYEPWALHQALRRRILRMEQR